MTECLLNVCSPPLPRHADHHRLHQHSQAPLQVTYSKSPHCTAITPTPFHNDLPLPLSPSLSLSLPLSLSLSLPLSLSLSLRLVWMSWRMRVFSSGGILRGRWQESRRPLSESTLNRGTLHHITCKQCIAIGYHVVV